MGARWAWLIGAGALSVVGFEIHSLGLREVQRKQRQAISIYFFLVS